MKLTSPTWSADQKKDGRYPPAPVLLAHALSGAFRRPALRTKDSRLTYRVEGVKPRLQRAITAEICRQRYRTGIKEKDSLRQRVTMLSAAFQVRTSSPPPIGNPIASSTVNSLLG